MELRNRRFTQATLAVLHHALAIKWRRRER